MSVRYKQHGERLLIEMWNPDRAMPRWLVAVIAIVTLSVLAALWAGFVYLKPWELTTFNARYHARRNLANLVALSALLVVTVRGELVGNREALALDGTSMVYTRHGRIGIRLNKRYDLREVRGLTVEPSWIAFEYAGKRHTIGHLLDEAERREVVLRVKRHWDQTRRRQGYDHQVHGRDMDQGDATARMRP